MGSVGIRSTAIQINHGRRLGRGTRSGLGKGPGEGPGEGPGRAIAAIRRREVIHHRIPTVIPLLAPVIAVGAAAAVRRLCGSIRRMQSEN